jgi:hypothetical protein
VTAKRGASQDRDHADKARQWSRAVDRTEQRINEANRSGGSAEEKLRELLRED